MSITPTRQKLVSILKSQPWNFQATLMRNEVQSLESPVNNEKYFPQQTYVGLFKDFAEALQSNDYETLMTLTEPSMREQIGPNLDELHSLLKEENLDFKIECNRKHADETSIFLYNIENFFLVDTKSHASLNRSKFREEWSNLTMQDGEEFKVSYPYLDPRTNEASFKEKDISLTQIANTHDIN